MVSVNAIFLDVQTMADTNNAQKGGNEGGDWTNAFIDLGSGAAVAYHPDVKLAVDPSIDVDIYERDPTLVLINRVDTARSLTVCRNATVADPVHVTSETGRTYHGYKEGSEFLAINIRKTTTDMN